MIVFSVMFGSDLKLSALETTRSPAGLESTTRSSSTSTGIEFLTQKSQGVENTMRLLFCGKKQS
jgi:hypothetical protein